MSIESQIKKLRERLEALRQRRSEQLRKPARAKKAAKQKPHRAAPPKTPGAAHPEALAWLEKNHNRNPLCNMSSREAEHFVGDLYACGAKRVVLLHVYKEPWRIKQEGGPYARELRVYGPEKALDCVARLVIERTENSMAISNGKGYVDLDLKYV